MINTELLKLPNLITLSIIIMVWLVIHDKFIVTHVVKDTKTS